MDELARHNTGFPVRTSTVRPESVAMRWGRWGTAGTTLSSTLSLAALPMRVLNWGMCAHSASTFARLRSSRSKRTKFSFSWSRSEAAWRRANIAAISRCTSACTLRIFSKYFFRRYFFVWSMLCAGASCGCARAFSLWSTCSAVSESSAPSKSRSSCAASSSGAALPFSPATARFMLETSASAMRDWIAGGTAS